MEKEVLHDVKMPEISVMDCDVGWVVVDAYLEGLEVSAQQLFDDLEYKRLFDELRRYVDLQLYGDEKSQTIDMKVKLYRENAETE